VATTRALPLTRLGGTWQMAIDSWLLDQGRPALRLYRWQRPCLSLGRHQTRLPERWQELAAGGRIELVRRPSGGAAVLHGGDLSYALVWPDPPGQRQEAYRLACHWLQQAFGALGQPLRFGDQPAGLAAASCFATRTVADLVHGDGSKRIGSAQLWRGGVLLQHGSIQMAPDGQLWRQLFGRQPPALPPLPVGPGELEEALMAAAARWLVLPPLQQQPLSAAELTAIAGRLAQGRVEPVRGSASGADCPAADSVTSPEASIERTTWGSASPRG
jgi:lipoate-protein ligase A